ncbi:MAG: hypothetical protein OXN83_03270, partial [Oligoflexia bacterium]|nr:hypothetical protein [Oligoflexia bacterium]
CGICFLPSVVSLNHFFDAGSVGASISLSLVVISFAVLIFSLVRAERQRHKRIENKYSFKVSRKLVSVSLLFFFLGIFAMPFYYPIMEVFGRAMFVTGLFVFLYTLLREFRSMNKDVTIKDVLIVILSIPILILLEFYGDSVGFSLEGIAYFAYMFFLLLLAFYALLKKRKSIIEVFRRKQASQIK